MPKQSKLQIAENNLLTAREEEVAYWNAIGKTNPEIAILLNISSETVKDHLKHIFDKLHVYNRTAMVTEAFRHGILKFACVMLALFVQLYIEGAGIDSLRPRPTGRIRVTRTTRKNKQNQELAEFQLSPGVLA